MTTQYVIVRLTVKEAKVLAYAAESVADDVAGDGGECMGWTGSDTAAYRRAIEKLNNAVSREPDGQIRQTQG